jgi:hypothetical protein
VVKNFIAVYSLVLVNCEHLSDEVLAFGAESTLRALRILKLSIFDLIKYFGSILSYAIERVGASYKQVKQDSNRPEVAFFPIAAL